MEPVAVQQQWSEGPDSHYRAGCDTAEVREGGQLLWRRLRCSGGLRRWTIAIEPAVIQRQSTGVDKIVGP